MLWEEAGSSGTEEAPWPPPQALRPASFDSSLNVPSLTPPPWPPRILAVQTCFVGPYHAFMHIGYAMRE